MKIENIKMVKYLMSKIDLCDKYLNIMEGFDFPDLIRIEFGCRLDDTRRSAPMIITDEEIYDRIYKSIYDILKDEIKNSENQLKSL
jgi:hypothetical protein